MEKRLRVVVIDDDPLERARLLGHLRAALDVEVVGALAGDRDAIDSIKRLSPDVIFLDVRLRACTGFELLSALGQDACSKIVFVTREREHAIRAFEVGALDYIIKPVSPERLERALSRVRTETGPTLDERARGLLSKLERLVRPWANGGKAGENFLGRVPVKEGGRVYFVRTSTVDWIESADNYVRLHTGSKSHLVRKTVAQLEAELDPAQFVRIHRRTIVNLDRIREIQPGIGRYRLVVLETGVQLRLSDRYYQRLVQEARGPGGDRTQARRRIKT